MWGTGECGRPGEIKFLMNPSWVGSDFRIGSSDRIRIGSSDRIGSDHLGSIHDCMVKYRPVTLGHPVGKLFTSRGVPLHAR
jgi:hypothetical protein